MWINDAAHRSYYSGLSIGQVNAVFQFFSTTVSLGAVGMFGIAGYNPDACPFDQSAATKLCGRMTYAAGPALVKIIFFCVMSRWPIRGGRLQEMETWIAEHGQASATQRVEEMEERGGTDDAEMTASWNSNSDGPEGDDTSEKNQ